VRDSRTTNKPTGPMRTLSHSPAAPSAKLTRTRPSSAAVGPGSPSRSGYGPPIALRLRLCPLRHEDRLTRTAWHAAYEQVEQETAKCGGVRLSIACREHSHFQRACSHFRHVPERTPPHAPPHRPPHHQRHPPPPLTSHTVPLWCVCYAHLTPLPPSLCVWYATASHTPAHTAPCNLTCPTMATSTAAPCPTPHHYSACQAAKLACCRSISYHNVAGTTPEMHHSLPVRTGARNSSTRWRPMGFASTSSKPAARHSA
jgi:hypothetical protein